MIIIPKFSLVPTDDVPKDPNLMNLKVVRYQTDEQARTTYLQNGYQFQHEPAKYTVLSATLNLKGAKGKYRLVTYLHLNMGTFTEVVRYDPADPPRYEDYEQAGMKRAHEQTQSDFKGQKQTNMQDFRNYILEGIAGSRPVYLPTISGWQSQKVFANTVFVAYDESDPFNMYGKIYLPKAPVMQADGQTQTAAIFAAAKSADSHATQARDTLFLTLELELNVDERQAAQSFADRNGRGTKKNRNLVISFDTSSALSELRYEAIKGTVFEHRLNDGRSAGVTEATTSPIADLSTMEQMLLFALTGDRRVKPEQFKHHYVPAFLPFAKEFTKLMSDSFSNQWQEKTPPNTDPFRKLYVHGWAFAQKGIALAYYKSRIDQLGPLASSIGKEADIQDGSLTMAQRFAARVEQEKEQHPQNPVIPFQELVHRLHQIDWLRYRKHWILITGFAKKAGGKKTFRLKSTNEEKVVGQAQNTPQTIAAVADKILSNSWQDLCSSSDEPLK